MSVGLKVCARLVSFASAVLRTGDVDCKGALVGHSNRDDFVGEASS